MSQSNFDVKRGPQTQSRGLSRTSRIKKAATAVFVIATALSFLSGFSKGEGAPPQEPVVQKQAGRGERFDFLVRADFFAGFAGDEAALARGMKVCEEALAKNPQHAEAMVWHGSGLVFLAGQAFLKADLRKGAGLWDRGLNEMDKAVELEPGNVGVLIPRGATLLVVSRFAGDPGTQRRLLEKGANDYEKVLEIQKPYFNTLSGHARGELLIGLAEGWVRLGNKEKARAYFTRIVDECKDSDRHAQAAEWLRTGALASSSPMSCTGCHKR